MGSLLVKLLVVLGGLTWQRAVCRLWGCYQYASHSEALVLAAKAGPVLMLLLRARTLPPGQALGRRQQILSSRPELWRSPVAQSW